MTTAHGADRTTEPPAIVILSPGLRDTAAIWGELVVARGVAAAARRLLPGARVSLVDATEADGLVRRRVDLLVSLCTGPRPPWRVDHIGSLVAGVTILWVANHGDLLDAFADLEMDGFATNSRSAIDVLGRRRPAIWVPLGVDPRMRRVRTRRADQAEVVFLGSGGRGNKAPATNHRDLDPAKAFDFHLWGGYWSREYWEPVHRDDPAANDWHRFWRGPLPERRIGYLYSSAGVVLGHHEDTQREAGMWNNRVFEALAVGAPFICDRAIGLAETFGEGIMLTDGGEETADHIRRVLRDPAEARRRAAIGAAIVRERFTYDHAAAALIGFAARLAEERGDPPRLAAALARSTVAVARTALVQGGTA
ncbi:MAG: glycosyltransferase [Chloroflexota bacterium]